MALEYGINFNTEEGRKKAEREILQWKNELQKKLDGSPLGIKLGEKGSRVTSQLQGYRKELQDLRNEYRRLTTAELANGKGQEVIDKYRALQKQVGIYGGTLDQVVKAQDRMAKGASRSVPSIDMQTNAFKRQSDVLVQLKTYAMNFLSVYAGIRLVKNLARITGEFEMQRVSIQAILQDAEKGEAIFNRIKGLAVISPFQFKELVTYTKQLSAFSVPYEELYDTTKMLADLSAGLGVGMDRLILAYGQIRSASVLRGQEVRQLTEAGIPIIEELRKKLSEVNNTIVTTGDVFDYISARKVPFEMVRDVLVEMTAEGGKFYKMQEKQADTLKGKISNLADAFEIMLNSIGESDGGIMKGAVDVTRSLMENYEILGKSIVRLATTYGVARVALELFHVATHRGVISSGLLRKSIEAQIKVQGLLNKALLTNPYASVALLVAGLTTGIWALYKASYSLNNEISNTNKVLDAVNGEYNKEINLLTYLYTKLRNAKKGTDEYRTAKEAIISQFGKYNSNLETEIDSVNGLTSSYEKLKVAMLEAYQTKGYEEAIAKANERYAKERTEAEDGIIKQLNKKFPERAGAILADINKYIDTGVLTKELDDIIKTYNSVLTQSSTYGQAMQYEVNDLEKYINNARNALAVYEETASYIEENTKVRAKAREAEAKGVKEELADWQKMVKDFVGQTGAKFLSVTPDDGTAYKYISRIREEYQELNTQYETYSTLVDEGSKEQAQALKQQISLVQELSKAMGFSLDKSGGGKTSKNPNIALNAMTKAEERLAELREKMRLEEQKYIIEKEQADIDRLEDGTAKKLKQIEITHKREMLAIDEREQALLKSNKDIERTKWEAQGKQGVFDKEITLTRSQMDMLETMRQTADANELKAKEDLLKDMLDEYKDFSQKVEAIEIERIRKVNDLNYLRNGKNNGQIDKAINEVNERAKKETAKATFDELKKSDAWRILFSDLEDYTLKTLKDTLKKIEKTDLSSLNASDAKQVQKGIDKLRKFVFEKDPIYALKIGWEEFIKSTEENQPDLVVKGMNAMIDGTETLLSYLDEAQGLVDAVFGENSGLSFGLSSLRGGLDSVSSIGDGIGSLMKGDISGVKSIIKGITGSINVFRKIRNRKHEREIKRQEEIVRDLEVQYNKLGKAMENSLGSDYYKSATEQSENLRKQADAIDRQISAERKKGKDKDKGKLEDLQRQRDELIEQSGDVVKQAIAKLAGTTLVQGAEDFANAWMDAYISFGNTSQAIQDRFKDMMRNMVVNSMLSSIMKKWMEPMFDMIEDAWRDKSFDPKEVSKIWELGLTQLTGANEEAEKLMGVLEGLSVDLRDQQADNLTGISKGIASITEDTALILGGYLDSIRLKLFQYIDFMMLPENRPTVAVIAESQITMINHLRAIELNTQLTAESNSRILSRIDDIVISTTTGKGWAVNINME